MLSFKSGYWTWKYWMSWHLPQPATDPFSLWQVKVMHKQLLLFHNAVSAYFSGNQTALEATLKQFNIKLRSPNTAPPSWLEQWVMPAVSWPFSCSLTIRELSFTFMASFHLRHCLLMHLGHVYINWVVKWFSFKWSIPSCWTEGNCFGMCFRMIMRSLVLYPESDEFWLFSYQILYRHTNRRRMQ